MNNSGIGIGNSDALLELRGLSVDIAQGVNALRVVKDVSLTVRRGEAVGLVGESGSGKSMTAFAVMNLFPSPLARVAAGEIVLEGQDLARMPAAALRGVRGARVGMGLPAPPRFLPPRSRCARMAAPTGSTPACWNCWT